MIEAIKLLRNKVDVGYFIGRQELRINKEELDINKCDIYQYINLNDITLDTDIEKSKKTATVDYFVCNCIAYKNDKRLMEFRSTLIRKNNNLYKKNINECSNQYEYEKKGSLESSIEVISKTKNIVKSKEKLITKFQDKGIFKDESKSTNKVHHKNKIINSDEKEFFKIITKEEVYRFSRISEDPNYIHKTKNPVVQAMLILLFLEDYLALRKIHIYDFKITYIEPILADKEIFLRFHDLNSLVGICENKICFKLSLKSSNIPNETSCQ